MWRAWAGVALAWALWGCNGKAEGGTSGSTAGSTAGSTSGSSAGSSSGGTSGSTGTTASTGSSGGATSSGSTGGSTGSAAVCTAPLARVDTSHPAHVVGTGTAASCTEAAFDAALQQGGVITFSCGGPATIPITVEHALSLTADTTIDGAGQITLEGQHTVRLLGFHSANFRATHTVVTLQGLTLKGGRATGTALPAAPAPCSQGYDLDGSGGALFMRDGILHVIDSTFVDNEAASPGPDVAGGAIYVVGSLEATIVGSTFTGNRASNGGAVGSLFSNLTLVNDAFTGNQATGTGANSIDPSCHVNGGESGDGGNGGAVVMDGGEDFAVLICGCRFTSNTAGAFGGGVFRTPDIGRQTTTLDRTVFDQNRAKGAGAAYFHHTDLTVTATTFSANQAEGGGALQADDTVLTATNSTWAGNVATHGLGGAVALFGNGGALAYCTFVGNTSPGGSGLFGAALAGGTALTITGTLFAANTDQDCGAPMACQDGTSPGADNLQWPATHAVCSNADPACAAGTTFADPMLGALGDHGGPTPTAAPGRAARRGARATAARRPTSAASRGRPRAARWAPWSDGVDTLALLLRGCGPFHPGGPMPTRKSNMKRDLQNLQAQTLAGIVEAGFLMAAADGQITEQEIQVVVGVITGFTDGLASNDEVEKLVMACATALDKDGWEARLQVVAGHLATKELRHYGLLCAALVLVSDEEAQDEEIDLFSDMAEAFGFNEDDANDVLDEAEDLIDDGEDDL